MSFGQFVIGSPGAGKSTYCSAMSQFLIAVDRPCAVVNLDPAAEELPYTAAVDIRELIQVDDVMEEFHLGPNGALVYCVEFMLKNWDWFASQMKEKVPSGAYVLFDTPGQIELYTHQSSIQEFCARIQKELYYQLCAVHLVDSVYCLDAAQYLSVVLVSMQAMFRLELPHINVLSKVDLLARGKDLEMPLEFYKDANDWRALLRLLNRHKFGQRYKRLNAALVDAVEGYDNVWFLTLFVQNKRSMFRVLQSIDKANGYCYAHRLTEKLVQISMESDSVAGFDDEQFLEQLRKEHENKCDSESVSESAK